MSIFSKIGSFFKNLFKKDKEEEAIASTPDPETGKDLFAECVDAVNDYEQAQEASTDESVTSSVEEEEPVTVVETDNTLEEKEAEVCEPEPATDFAASENISVVAQEELEPEPAVEEAKEADEAAPAAEFKSFAPIDEDDRAAILEIIRPIVKKANASEAYLAYIKENDMDKKNFKCYSAMTDDQQLVIRLTQSASYNEKLAGFVETLVPEIETGFKDLSMNIVLNVSSNNGFIFVRKFAAD